MKRIVYKDTIIGGSWEDKITAFLSAVKLKNPNADEVWRSLVENIMIRDLIFDVVYNLSEEKKFTMFKNFNDIIEKQDADLRPKGE